MDPGSRSDVEHSGGVGVMGPESNSELSVKHVKGRDGTFTLGSDIAT